MSVKNYIEIYGDRYDLADGVNLASSKEESSTAVYAHGVGERFLYMGELYEATQAIAVGGTITPNTNCTRVYLGDELTQLKSQIKAVGNPNPLPIPALYSTSEYTITISSGTAAVSDYIIPAKSRIVDVELYSGISASVYAYIVFIGKTSRKCLASYRFAVVNGKNTVAINASFDEDVYLGTYNSQPLYINDNSIGNEYLFSSGGLGRYSPLTPEVGDTMTLSKTYSGKFALAIQCHYINNVGYALDLVETHDTEIAQMDAQLDSVETAVTNIYLQDVAPTLYAEAAYDTGTIADGTTMVSDVVIPAGKYINTIKIYSAVTAAQYAYVVIIGATSLTCLNNIRYTANPGWNVIPINRAYVEGVRIGTYYSRPPYKNGSGIPSGYVFSSGGLGRYTPLSPNIGDTMELYKSYSGDFALPIQWDVSSGTLTETNQNVAVLQKYNRIRDEEAIAAFIDDDGGAYAPHIWGQIIAESPIRMGFAVITGFISGEVESPITDYDPMTLVELKTLYDAGHEVYSHSYSHPAFYLAETTEAEIERQCRLSKQWLDQNGYSRNSDVIVYPGGLGQNETGKQAVVRQFYRYGIDTVGGGINILPFNNTQCIFRTNADTGTLAELKDIVDNAKAEGGLVVFMNHAYELQKDETNQINKMVALIEYIKEIGVKIMPFEEAVRRKAGW